MDIVSVVANPPALMKSSLESRGEIKGADPKVKDQVKFGDVLSKKKTETTDEKLRSKPEVSEEQTVRQTQNQSKQPTRSPLNDKLKSPMNEKPGVLKNEKKSEVETTASDENRNADETSDEVSQKPEFEANRFQQGLKADKPKTERQKAILTFMDSFESEFGIPPQEMVAAMAKLSHSELARGPEETADAVIKQLGLDDDQESAAKDSYVGLLMQLHHIDQTNPTSPMTPANSSSLLQSQVKERIDLGHDRKIQRDLALQSLNNRFWMKNPESSQAIANKGIAKEGQDSAEEIDLTQNLSGPNDERLVLNQMKPMDSGMEGQIGQNKSFDLKDLNLKPEDLNSENLKISPEDMKKLTQQMRAQKEMKAQSQSDDGLATAKVNQSQGLDSQKDPQKMNSKETAFMVAREMPNREGGSGNHSGHSDSGFQKNMAQSDGKAGGLKNPSAKMNVEELDFRQISAAMNPESSGLKSAELSKLGTPAIIPGQSQNSQGAPEANVRQIMNQAQYLIKNGGGEMKVQMTPEGLGTVQLKVMVSNGKVNVQMLTDSKEAKNAIESSMADLKNSLSAQKLSVEHVKVDVVAGANTDNQSQSSNSSLNQNAQRDSTKQFWNQFQDNFGNRSQRDNFFDVDTKGYSPKRSRDPLQPVEGPSVARLKDGKGSGLNLVA